MALKDTHISGSNIFNGVMDQDSDTRLIQKGNYIYAKNIHNDYTDKLGAVRNIKGTVKVDYTLPAGENIVIGNCENRQCESIIYFVYNDQGNHSILEFFPNENGGDGFIRKIAEDQVFAFNKDWAVHSARIVDGTLLYWTDGCVNKKTLEGNPPRALNIDRAISIGKKSEYRLFGGVDGQPIGANGTEYSIQVTNKETGAVIVPSTIFFTVPNDSFKGDVSVILGLIGQVLNTSYLTYVITELCEQSYLRVDAQSEEYKIEITTSAAPVDIILVPENHYPDTLSNLHIDLIKQPPLCPPEARYFRKEGIGFYNNLNDSPFQFRIRYRFADGEYSSWGPISIAALNIDECGDIVTGLNAVKLTYTDPILNTLDGLSVIRNVEIAFRQSDTDIWKYATILERSEIGLNSNIYTFLNENLASVVPSDDATPSPDLQVLKDFDRVPLVTAALEIVSDNGGQTRLYVDGTIEGYDPTNCIDIRHNVLPEKPNGDYIDITGTVSVHNFPIDFIPDRHPTYEAWPLNGFVVYLAGTDYFAISDGVAGSSLNQSGSFTISNVPPGIYIMRVAHYYCGLDNTFGSVHNIANERFYQNSSAPIYEIAGITDSERLLDLRSFAGPVFDLDTEPGFGDIKIWNMYWGVPVSIGGANWPIMYEVYLRDNDGEIGGDENLKADGAVLRAANGVERQKVFVDVWDGDVSNPIDYLQTISEETDHNGYFIMAFTTSSLRDFIWLENPRIQVPDSGIVTDLLAQTDFRNFNNPGIWYDVLYRPPYNADILYASGVLGNNNVQIRGSIQSGLERQLWFNKSPILTEEDKTFIVGKLIDSDGIPVSNSVVQYTHTGGSDITDEDGNYRLRVYADGFTYGAAERRLDNLIINPPYCFFEQPTFDPDQIVSVDIDFTINNYLTEVVQNFTLQQTQELDVNRYLKMGGVYRVGIQYIDSYGRKGPLETNDSTLFRIGYHTQIDQYSRPVVLWNIYHRPPAWAVKFQMLRTIELTQERYLVWAVEDVRYVRVESDLYIDTSYDNGDFTHIFIKLDNRALFQSDDNVDPVFFSTLSEGINFLAGEGDKVRFIYDANQELFRTSGMAEFPIVGYQNDGTDYYMIVQSNSTELLEVTNGALIELFTPKQAESQLYYEVGECHDIIDPGTPDRRHAGGYGQYSQDQTFAPFNPAIGEYIGGDTYWRRRQLISELVPAQSTNYLIEDAYLYDGSNIKNRDIGRPAVENPNERQVYHNTRLRYSQKYIPDSLINGLSSFGALDFKDINKSFGSAVKLIMADNVMLSIHQFDTQPIYVGKDSVLGLRGENMLAQSDKIITFADELQMRFGTHNPESVIEYLGKVYAWDANRGVVWRYSVNGQDAVSNRFMAAFFKQTGRRYYQESKPKIRVWGGFDRVRMQYILSFSEIPGEEGQPAFTISYSENKTGFPSEFDYYVEQYSAVGENMVSFKNGELWWHERGELYNNFHGNQYSSLLKFSFNDSPKMKKLFWNLTEQTNSNEPWWCPEITTPANKSYKNGMTSRLMVNHFNNYEGKYDADFRRDYTDDAQRFLNIVDPAQRELEALIYGRPLRGDHLIVTLQNDETTEVVLLSTDVEYYPSMDTKG